MLDLTPVMNKVMQILYEDWYDLSGIILDVEESFPHLTSHEMRDAVIEIVRRLADEGMILVGTFRDGFAPDKCDVADSIARIEAEWRSLDQDNNEGVGAWSIAAFEITDKGRRHMRSANGQQMGSSLD